MRGCCCMIWRRWLGGDVLRLLAHMEEEMGLKGKRVAGAFDFYSARLLLTRMLEQLGLEVANFETGREAIEIAATDGYDLLIIKGDEFWGLGARLGTVEAMLAELERMDSRSLEMPPTLFLSAELLTEGQKERLRMRSITHFELPVDIDELLDAVEALLEPINRE
jgi:DNA-binding response OmpR family regulator